MKTIILKELTEYWRDGRFKFSLGLLFVLLLIAGFTGYNQFNNSTQQHEHSKAEERHMWETQGEKNPHSAAHYGTYAFKPKMALSLFDNGVNQYTGNSIFLEAHSRNEAAYSEASDQTELARYGSLSINFVMLYLFSLLILLMGFNAFTKERELKTMRLLKSQGVSPIKLTIGKWLAVFLPIFALSTIIFLVVGIVLSANKDTGFFNWNNLLVLYLTYTIYYMIMVTITLLISLVSNSSGISLVSSLFIWILFCFITPKIATNVANNLHAYPTKQEFEANVKVDKEKGIDGHNPWSKAAEKLKEETLKEYGVDSVQQLPFNYNAYRMQKGEEHEAQVYKKHYNLLKDVFKSQNKVYQKLAILSPFIPARTVSMDVANTGYIAHWNFTDAAEDYRILTMKFLNDEQMNNSKMSDRGFRMKADRFKDLPEFVYQPPQLSEIVNWSIPNFMILLAWLIVPFVFLLVFAKKM